MSSSQDINQLGGGKYRITVDDHLYERVGNNDMSRKHRSDVSLYTGEDIKDMLTYQYERLNSMRRRIRLLRLHGGGLSNPEITCELFEVQYDPKQQNVVRTIKADGTLGTVIEYEALSWCWGREQQDRAIRVQRGGEYYRLAVTKELSLALKYLRRPHQNRILWIDALCIDQSNHEERNHQVQMMARIYNGATQACIWLGEDNDDSTKAIAFIDEIMKLENFDTVSEKKENASKWQSLLLLMRRPWFSRRWVVQEIALARCATIYCGTDQIPWQNFAVAVELFVEVETATHRLSEVMRKDERFGHVPQWFEHVSELGASVLVEATGKIFRRDGTQPIHTGDFTRSSRIPNRHEHQQSMSSYVNGPKPLAEQPDSSPWTLQRPLLSLEYLVSSLTVFEASQPRDAVYSLLAISRDTAPFAETLTGSQGGSEEAIIMSTVSSFLERKPFKVDYSRPYSDICKDFISFCIQRAKKSDPSRALDILCRPWAPDSELSMPGVTHKKPTLYKFLSESEGRERLWEPKRGARPQNQNGSETEINRKDTKRHQDSGGVPRSRTGDTESTQQYMQKITKEWEETGRKAWFEEHIEPYLPRKPTTPEEEREEKDGAQGSSTTAMSDGVPRSQNSLMEDISLPTWVSRISGASFAIFRQPGMQEGTRIGRQNADSLVGLPQDGHKTYSAAQNTKLDYRRLKFRKRSGKREGPGSGHSSLYTEGFILGKVDVVEEPARLGGIPKTWTELAGWKNAVDGNRDPPAEFWRTLVADRGKDHRNPPYYYATACKESVRKGGLQGGSVDTGALISKERNSIIAEFCRRVQAVIWNRRLIRTTITAGEGSKALGLARQDVKEGDLVCILFGCTVPVILRESKRKKKTDVEAERIQDAIEIMKTFVSTAEEACFRKNRYRRKLREKQRESDNLDQKTLWQIEVEEATKVINEEMEEWKLQDENAFKEAQRIHAKQKQKRINSQKETRFKEQKALTSHNSPISPTKQVTRSITMPIPSTLTTDLPVGEPTELMDVDDGAHNEAQQQQQHQQQQLKRHGHSKSVDQVDQGPPQDDGVQERKNKAAEEDSYLHYTFIGEAYIHGMMDGEAVRLQINENIPKRMFEIR